MIKIHKIWKKNDKIQKNRPFSKKQEIDGEMKKQRGKWIWSNGPFFLSKSLIFCIFFEKNVILPLISVFLKKPDINGKMTFFPKKVKKGHFWPNFGLFDKTEIHEPQGDIWRARDLLNMGNDKSINSLNPIKFSENFYEKTWIFRGLKVQKRAILTKIGVPKSQKIRNFGQKKTIIFTFYLNTGHLGPFFGLEPKGTSGTQNDLKLWEMNICVFKIF